jgi:hypothetical protein
MVKVRSDVVADLYFHFDLDALRVKGYGWKVIL